MLIGIGLLAVGYTLNISSLKIFFLLFSLVIVIAPPRLLVSPLSMIHGYYFVWFLFAPAFSTLHAEDNFATNVYYAAYGMVFLTYVTAVFGARSGEKSAYRHQKHQIIKPPSITLKSNLKLGIITIFLYTTSTLLVVAIVTSSGGLSYWVQAPGEAFLNRQGSGVYVVLSHFSTFCLSAISGYRSYISKRKTPLIIFIIWLAITSPVHGSKGVISLFLILSLTPWLRTLKFTHAYSIVFVSTLVFIFFFGLYLRNISWITAEEAVPYALNYFTTLRNLIILFDDFSPDFLLTFFLPFNKFLTPFGLSDQSLYFNMNHLLTDKYFPTAWEIRATEQWPVEADLYLNFYFIFGLPIIFLYTFIIGLIYGGARMSNNLGIWIVAMLLIVSMISHLRGSIINHLDFYLYPMFFVIYLLLRRRSFSDRTL